MLVKILATCLCTATLSLSSFQSLHEFEQYAATHLESPESDNGLNWNDPDYSTYVKSITPTWFGRLMHKIGLYKAPLVDGWKFKQQLESVMTAREQLGLNYKYALYMRCTPETRIFLWSDIHGGFHSLVRDLTYLQSKEIIGDDLKIKNSNHYFVFNGDYIDRSPYSIEVLSIMFALLTKNPEQVIYMRGKHETNNYWQNFGTKRQFMTELKYVDPQHEIPLGHMLSRFFETLPVVLYLSCLNPNAEQQTQPQTFEPIPVIRISHFGWENKLVNEKQLGTLFLDQEGKQFTRYNVTQHQPTTNPVDVKILIKTEEWLKERRTETGFGMLDQDLGAITWAVLSTPIPIHQHWLDFYYDAFIEIAIRYPIEDTTVTLYSHDIRKKDDFKIAGVYSLYTGAPYVEGTTQPIKKALRIGSSMALLTNLVSLSQKTKQGMAIRINEENRKGGINGHPIRLYVLNDDYEPNIARQNILELHTQDHIDIFLLCVGSPTLSAYIDYVKDKKIIVLFPITGAPQFRSPEIKGLVNWQPRYSDEVTQLMSYTINELGVRKFAFFYQDDSFGTGPLQAAHEVLKKYGITEWTEVPYARASSDLKAQAKKIAESQADAIGLFSVSDPTEELFRDLGIDALANKQLLGLSDLAEEAFHVFLNQHGIDMIFGAFVPNPATSQLEIVKEYRAAMDAVYTSYDMFSLVGYITTSLLIEVAKMVGEPITKDRILQQIESFKNYQFKGLTLTFDPNRRDLSQPVWIEAGEGKEWTQKTITK